MSEDLIKQIDFFLNSYGGTYPLSREEFQVLRKSLESRFEGKVAPEVKSEPEEAPMASWEAMTRPGQIKKGDRLRLGMNDKTLTVTALEILNPGQPTEEIVYNRKRNFFFIVSKVLEGSSYVKTVEFMKAGGGRHTGDRLCEEKTESIMERGYAHCGYVLANPVGEYCIINGSAVRWLGNSQMWTLMHAENPEVEL